MYPLFFSKAKTLKLGFTSVLEHVYAWQGVFSKTSGFGYSVKFDFESLSLRCLVDDFK